MPLKSRVYKIFILFLLVLSAAGVAGCGNKDKSATMQLMFYVNSGDLRDIAELRRLIKAGADVNSIRADGYALLQMASKDGNVEVVRMLLEDEHTKVDQVTANGDTALFLAAGQGHLEVVRLLLLANADVNKICPNNFTGYTPLTTAFHYKRDEVAKLLKEYGADR